MVDENINLINVPMRYHIICAHLKADGWKLIERGYVRVYAHDRYVGYAYVDKNTGELMRGLTHATARPVTEGYGVWSDEQLIAWYECNMGY